VNLIKYTPEEDQLLLSYTADLDPDDYDSRVDEFTSRFKQASLHLPGRTIDALRKRYKRLQAKIKWEKREPATNPVARTPYRKIVTPLAQSQPIGWDEPFIQPPSKEQLMGRR
jgi:hypothetical protein